MTERQARASFMLWCDQVRVLEAETYRIYFKGHAGEIQDHERRLTIARAAKSEAFDALRLYQALPQRTRPVRLSLPNRGAVKL